MLQKITEEYSEDLYAVFRALVGFLFVQHGAQKLFGVLGGNAVDLVSLMGLAGIIEFFGGIMIAIGFFSWWAALFGVADMVGAWFIAHAPQGWIPITNNGEPALLFLASFLVILSKGSGKYSIDDLLSK